jgi:hypothetical protein
MVALFPFLLKISDDMTSTLSMEVLSALFRKADSCALLQHIGAQQIKHGFLCMRMTYYVHCAGCLRSQPGKRDF